MHSTETSSPYAERGGRERLRGRRSQEEEHEGEGEGHGEVDEAEKGGLDEQDALEEAEQEQLVEEAGAG